MRWLIHSVLLLSACGGGGSPSPQAAAGQFVEDRLPPNADDARSSPSRTTGHRSDRLEGWAPASRVARLVSALDDVDPSIRVDAIEALGDLGDPEGVSALWPVLYCEDAWLKLSAIEALGDIGTDEAAMALGPLLSDVDPEMREAVVDALVDIDTYVAHGYLDQALADSNSNVRATASEALAELLDYRE